MEFSSTESSETIGPCEFRCHRDAKCLPRWSQVCDGRADCADRSDEAKCSPSATFLQPPSSQHQTQQTPSPHPEFMQEISGIQICIVAVALVLTLGLITCVINHYNKMGAKPWSGDQRKHDHSRKSTSATTTRALYSPSKAQEHAKKELLLYQEHQLRTLSVQRDIALNLPSTVQRPDTEENQRQPLSSRSNEIPRAYLRPPPNRTVVPGGMIKCPNVRQHSSSSMKTGTGYQLVTHPSFHQTTKKNNPSFFVRVSNSLERWNPPRIQKDVCTIAIYEDTTTDSDDLPPKYEDVVHTPILSTRTSKNSKTCSSVIQSFRKITQ